MGGARLWCSTLSGADGVEVGAARCRGYASMNIERGNSPAANMAVW
jgi:hypothetical protein